MALALVLATPSLIRGAEPEPAAPTTDGTSAAPAAEASPEAIGAALHAALRTQEEGDPKAAAAAFAEIATAHPVIADHAHRLQLEALTAVGESQQVVDVAGRVIPLDAGSPVLADLYRLEGDALAALERGAEARDAWTRALGAEPASAEVPALREKLARSLDGAGLLDAAIAEYLWVWRDAPASDEAREAGERLAALEATREHPFRSASDWRERANTLFEAGHTELALASYDRALAIGLDASTRQEAQLRRAECLFRLRRYAEAEVAFQALAPNEEAALLRGRSIARGGDVPRAVTELLALAETSSPAMAAQARWYAGLLLDDEPDGQARARALFLQVAAQTDEPDLAPQALWRLGWSAYREGHHAEARAQLARMAAVTSDEVAKLQARYWSARAAEKSGALDDAAATFAALASEYPFSYYGFHARERLAGQGRTVTPPGVAPDLGPLRLPSSQLVRPRILLAAGLPERAAREARPLARRSSTSLADRLVIARLFADAEDYHESQTLILDVLSDPLPRGPAPGSEEPWRLAWPKAYPAATTAALSGLERASAPLVWSIMREESGFRPTIVSSAGARGLLQLMPETGARLADQLGIRGFDAASLYDPRLNLRLGAYYLDTLARRFGGRLSAVAASYNAGPEAVSRWLAERGELPDDEWVEAIPYDQTRGYVKRVLRSVHVYEDVYERRGGA